MTTPPVEYCVPSKFKKAPYKTVIRVMQDEGNQVLYMQTSRDQENPAWMRLGAILEEVVGKSPFLEELIAESDTESAIVKIILQHFEDKIHNSISEVEESAKNN